MEKMDDVYYFFAFLSVRDIMRKTFHLYIFHKIYSINLDIFYKMQIKFKKYLDEGMAKLYDSRQKMKRFINQIQSEGG